MKISFISAIALGGALASTAPVAYAGSSMGYHSGSSYNHGFVGETADCPPGTSRSGDGTCLMNSGSTMAGGMSYGSSSYGGSSYSSGSTITSYSSFGGTADCPPGSNRAGDGTCMMSGGSSLGMGSTSSRTYGGSSSSSYTPSYSSSSSYTPSSSYSSYSSSSRSANCPAGSTRSADGVCMVQGGSSSSSYSYSSTPLNSYRGQSSYVVDSTVTSTMSDSEADFRYGSGSISGPYTDGSNTIVPFSTTSATLTNYRVPGMGSNEFLSPTDCPVNVYNPGGGTVLGCYQVSKPAPVRVTVPSYHTVRVVRPVIYVRYPVPTPVPMAMPMCGSHHWHSRYGNNWPRQQLATWMRLVVFKDLL